MSIKLKNVSYTYSQKTPFAFEALKNVSLNINDHSFLALIGETGSGKSTLVQHLNGLLLPTSGEVQVNNFLLSIENGKRKYVDLNKPQGKKYHKKQFNIKDLRKYAGLVFQFPEYQLFEETVLKDICFGPKNFGASEEEAETMARQAIELVGLDESYLSRSPFELSGGEKRRVAIAGIIALNPSVLILDEPTAGLDPQGEREMMELFKRIYDSGKSVILVTHNMDIVLKYVDEVIVMKDGHLLTQTTPLKLFQDEKFLANTAIEPPFVFKVAKELIDNGLNIDLGKIKDISSLVGEIGRVKHE
ncbi:MAG: energy-coupling factor transporter ATPase [Bacilli bacterium]|nr:energy-coupling factor transporter ATPase [Bacilli bacterium]